MCIRDRNNDIIFLIPPVGDLPENEECLYLTTTMHGVQLTPNINFVFLSIIKVSIYGNRIKKNIKIVF